MSVRKQDKVLALCGGVGGAKLALGLTRVLDAQQLTIVVNTGDDFEHYSLTVCPDLDTVSYTLAGLSDAEKGWGRGDETWQCLETLDQLGAETWFQLGDRDLALHLTRRALLGEGCTLSEVTEILSTRLGVSHRVVPMSDSPVRTMLDTERGELTFQDYFVRQQCSPTVQAIHFNGAEAATISKGFREALDDPQLAAILICPSNPLWAFIATMAICSMASSSTSRIAGCSLRFQNRVVCIAAIRS